MLDTWWKLRSTFGPLTGPLTGIGNHWGNVICTKTWAILCFHIAWGTFKAGTYFRATFFTISNLLFFLEKIAFRILTIIGRNSTFNMSEIKKHSVRLAVSVYSKCYLIFKNRDKMSFPYTTPSSHNTHTNHIQHHINNNNNNIHVKGSLPLALKMSLIF